MTGVGEQAGTGTGAEAPRMGGLAGPPRPSGGRHLRVGVRGLLIHARTGFLAVQAGGPGRGVAPDGHVMPPALRMGVVHPSVETGGLHADAERNLDPQRHSGLAKHEVG